MNPIREAYIRNGYNASKELGIAPFLAGDVAAFNQRKLAPRNATDLRDVDNAWMRWVDHVSKQPNK